MFCYLFYKKSVFLFLLLLLLLFCALCKNVSAVSIVPLQSSSTTTVNNVDLFKPEDINNVIKPDGNSEGKSEKNITVKNVTSPFLFAVDDLMFAVAEVNNTDKNKKDETKIDLMAKYISTTDEKWNENDITANKWKSQLITKNDKDIKFGFAARGVAVTKDKKKIYLLAVNNTLPTGDGDNLQWKLKWIVGAISDGTPNQNEKKISWSTKDVDNNKLVGELKKTFSKNPTKITLSAGGFAFLTKDNTIVFVLQASESDDDSKNVIAVTQIKDTQPKNGKAELELLHNETVENFCPYFFQWNEKIMMSLNNDQKNTGAKQTVKEFNFTTKKWEESKESISRLESFLNDKRDFTTARIGSNKKSVLLFTQQKTKNGDGVQNKKDVHLWVTDGDQLSDVGTVAANIDGGGDYYGSILHTNDELFILQQKYNNDEGGSVVEDTFELRRLKEQLEEIKKLLEIWKKADETVSTICGDESDGSSKKLCATQLSTDGLVGFLRDTSTNNSEWIDEYYYTNATVTNGKKVPNGFLFDGRGAGVKWPVGKTKEEDQPYNFTKYGFTLVATVTIGENKGEKDNSLLGVALSDKNNNLVKLWCTTGGKWSVSGRDDSQATPTQNQSCEQGKTYMVTLTLKNDGKGAVYVDGEQLSVDGRDFRVNTNSGNIAYFYFGANNADSTGSTIETHVTVTNVLLYNRPLEEEEIKKLKIINEEKQEGGEDSTKNSQNAENKDKGREDKKSTEGSDGGDENEGTPENTNNNNDNDEREGTSTLQSESSTVRGGVVGLLTVLLLLFLLDVSVSDV